MIAAGGEGPGREATRGMAWADEGFLLARGLLDAGTVSTLSTILERVHAAWLAEAGEQAVAHDLVNSSGLTARRFFAGGHGQERARLFDAIASGPLFRLVEAEIGVDLGFHGTQLFFDPLAGRRRPYWHRDLQYTAFDEDEQRALLPRLLHVHVRTPLRPESGFALVPGSHRRWDRADERAVRLERDGRRSHEALSGERRFALRPGDVLVFHAHMLHRGHYGAVPARLSLDVMLGRPHEAFPVSLEGDPLPTPEELSRIARPAWFERTLRQVATGAG